MTRTTRGRRKVLHLITRLIVGGAQDNTLITVAKHRRDRYEVHVAGNPNGYWADRAATVADRFHPLPDLVNPVSPRRDAATLAALVRLFRRERYDIVHTHSSKAGVLGRVAAKIAGVPAVIHTMHGPGIHEFMRPMQRRIYELAERAVVPCTDFIIAVSEANRRQATDRFGIAPSRARTVYSGIDLTALDRPADTVRARRDVGVPDGWKIVLFVGRLDDAKAPHLLVSAFEQVVRARPDTALVLVGSGEFDEQVAQQIRELGLREHVRMMGTRDDVPAFLAIADVFALSSLWEGVGRAMTEAMLYGVPVVVPAIYGIPEIVHDRETGILYPRGDVGALAAGILELLGDPELARRIGDRGRALTRRIFDADAMVRSIEDVYEQLLAGRR